MKPEFTLDWFAKSCEWAQSATKDALLAEQEVEILKETGKDLLARLMTDVAVSMTGRVAESTLERLARNSESWRVHREGLFAARRKAAEASIKRLNAQRHFECVQSGLSYRREEMRQAIAA